MKGNVIFESKDGAFRIVEHVDTDADMADLKGDLFDPRHMKSMGFVGTVEDLRREEKDFEELVEREGVFGYVLERKCSSCGQWDHEDSCWGFVGSYSPNDQSGKFDHYIVEEMKQSIIRLGGVA